MRVNATIYNASAGSGKTYRLAYNFVRDVVEAPHLYRHILAVTFTNKATEEMKRRILLQINRLASGAESPYMADLERDLGFSPAKIRVQAAQAQSNILHNYSRFTVLTIDKFFQRLLRAFIQELGIDIGYTLEIESSSIVDQGVDALIEEIAHDEALKGWLMGFVQERIDDGQRWDIRDGIIALSGELFKEQAQRALAAGVSRESLREIIAQRVKADEVAIKALQDVAKRALSLIDSAGLTCDNFKWTKTSGAQIFPRIISGLLPEINTRHVKCMESLDEWYTKTSPAAVRDIAPQLQLLLGEVIDLIEPVRRRVNTSKLMRENYRTYALLFDLFKKTNEICKEQNTMLLTQTADIVEKFVRDNDAPFIYEKVGNRYSRFMIDEFQDTSRREWNNFVPLLLNAISECEEGQNSILIVGDIKQSIYRWRGGDWRILHSDAARQLGRERTALVNMNDNYRSLPMVVNFNNEIISQVVKAENRAIEEDLVAAREKRTIGEACYSQLSNIIAKAYEGQRQNPKKRGDQEGFVEVVAYEGVPPIMERICEAIDRGFKPCEIMILTRTNPQATRVAQILLEFKRRIPDPRYRFDVMTQQALLVGYAPVSHFIMAVFRLIIDGDESLQRAIYNDFLGREVDTPLPEEEREFLRGLRLFAPIESFEKITKRYSLEQDRSNIAYIQAIHEQVIEFCNNRIGDVALFLKWWEQSGHTKSLNVERSEQAIEILTIHKAKGLEKRVVIIPYCDWELEPKASGVRSNYVWAKSGVEALPSFPVQFKKEMASSDFAEEYHLERVYSHIDSVNMLYVALTRAAESLHVLIPTTKDSKGERRAKGIGGVILGSLPSVDLVYTTYEDRGEEDGQEYERVAYQFGAVAPPMSGEEAQQREPYIMEHYESNPADLRLRMPSKRYREGAEYAPREVGILMHKAFEQAACREDIFKNIELMFANAQINEAEREELTAAIKLSLDNPKAREWFSAKWDRVRNESEIILPQSGAGRRPDRVMIKGDRCVVVDYKFGALQPAKYEKQMRQYMQLMQQMGYQEVEGYLWYIRSGEIVSV